MIGALIITHGNLGRELIKATELIKGPLTGVLTIAVDETKGVEELKKEIQTAIKKLDKGSGVLILTDLFGGTPSNISLSFLKESRVEVVTGVNLPMMMKLSHPGDLALRDLAALVSEYGRKNIYLASEVLNKKIAG
jgi:PTS system mannose-specific IIA component